MSRGRDLTAEERARLAAEGPRVFEAHGVINHERAVFARTVGENVIGSPQPLFSSMQPRIKHHNVEAWRHAYSFALAFLKSHNATETGQAIDMEFDKTGITGKPEILEDECPCTIDDFDQLLRGFPYSDDDFQARVSVFSEMLRAASPVGDASGSAFLTQAGRAPPPDEEEEGYEYEEYDPPKFAESGVQPEPPANPIPTGSPRSDSGFDIELKAFDVGSDED
jgi:hypothetical protein